MKGLTAAFILFAFVIGAFLMVALAFVLWLLLGWAVGEFVDWLFNGYVSHLANSVTGADLDGGDYGMLTGAVMGLIALATGISRTNLTPK
jgi:hypothetical protein